MENKSVEQNVRQIKIVCRDKMTDKIKISLNFFLLVVAVWGQSYKINSVLKVLFSLKFLDGYIFSI